jgi:hypothetical protein
MRLLSCSLALLAILSSTAAFADASDQPLSPLTNRSTPNTGARRIFQKRQVLSGDSLSSAFAAKVLNKPLVQNNLVGTVMVPNNFVLSFTITVTSVRPQWGNIFHVNSKNQDWGVLGARSPALWVIPSTSELHVVIGTTSDVNWHINTKALPLNQKTLVTIYAVDQYITIYFNGVRAHSALSPGTRYVGNALVYASGPFHEPATAMISSFEFKPHSSTTPADPEVAIQAARVEAARIEAARLARVEAARIEAARVEAARLASIEAARIEAARVEAARIEAARLASIEAARIEAARIETARIEAARVEAAQKAAADKATALKIAADKAAALKIAADKAAALKIANDKAAALKIATDKAAAQQKKNAKAIQLKNKAVSASQDEDCSDEESTE